MPKIEKERVERAVEALFREVGCRYDPRRVRAVLSGAAKNS